jgi:hypothetical protein
MTVTLDIRPELEAELRAEAEKAGLDANAFILKAIEERLHRSQKSARSLPSHLTREETALLQKINQGLPEDAWRQYRELIGKRREETMTPEEQAELIALSDRIEKANVQRMEHLAELARLRQTSLGALMHQLGIKHRRV